MKKKMIAILIASALVMTVGCNTQGLPVTSESTTESTTESVSESIEDISDKQPESSSAVAVSEFDKSIPDDYVPVKCADDAISNIYWEGTDTNSYSSAREYIETVKKNGMGVTLADTMAVFNRCGFEYFGSNDLDENSDDTYSARVLVTADGDKLYYFYKQAEDASFDMDDPTSWNVNYVLWGINDERNYALLAESSFVEGTYCGGYKFVDHSFPLNEEEDFDWWLGFLSISELRLIRNSVYAAHGRQFTSPDLAAIYGAQSWYRGTVEPAEFDKNVTDYLSADERKFVNTIAQREKELKALYEQESGGEYCSTLVNGSYIDLDGDGTKERVFWGWSSYEYDDREILFVNGGINVVVKFADGTEELFNYEGELTIDCVYYIKSDYIGMCLMAYSEGPSDDPYTDIYTVKDKKLAYHGYVLVGPTEIEWHKNHIIAGYRGGILNTEEIRTEYVLDSKGEFVINPNIDYFEYRGNTVKALKNIRSFVSKNGEIGRDIKTGEKFKILGGDEKNWVKVELTSGEQCWIKIESWKVVLADGTTEESPMAIEGIIVYD